MVLSLRQISVETAGSKRHYLQCWRIGVLNGDFSIR
jgi:hypothetical protein